MNGTQAETGLRGVDVAGPPDAPPIVFVHGAAFTGKMWAPQRRVLSDEFRVVAPDLPGHGARADRDFRLGRAVDLLDEVIDEEAGGNAVVVGLSLGGTCRPSTRAVTRRASTDSWSPGAARIQQDRYGSRRGSSRARPAS